MESTETLLYLMVSHCGSGWNSSEEVNLGNQGHYSQYDISFILPSGTVLLLLWVVLGVGNARATVDGRYRGWFWVVLNESQIPGTVVCHGI